MATMVQEIKVYTLPNCGPCKKVKAFFKRKGVKFEELDIMKNFSARRELEKMGLMSTPVVVRGKSIVVGFNASELNKLCETQT